MTTQHNQKPPAPTTPVRGEGRPVTRRTRTFRPNYLSFAGTYQCNLSCPHCCVPIEWPDRLDIPTALRFLEQAHAAGIETLGFTGGEPFLYPEFLLALTQRAAELGFRFDKLMTNGVWHRDAAAPARRLLTELRDAGLHRQARPERGQVPRHGHRRSSPSSAASRAAVFGRDNDPVAELREPPPGQGAGADPRLARRNSTAWSTGRTCSAATCS